MNSLTKAEYPADPGYLDTASHGLLPADAAAALRAAVDGMACGRLDQPGYFGAVEAARRTFAGLVDLPPDRVTVGSSVSAHVGLIAQSLPAGTEVLCAEGEFSSLVTPFAFRPGLRLRQVPLAGLAEAVGPGTGLVAVSSIQSADGAPAELAAIAEAAGRHGAATLVDTTQSTGWLPLDAGEFDYTVCGAFKWLLCPRGASFLTVPPGGGPLVPLSPSWAAAVDPASSVLGVVEELAPDARRFDTSPAFLPYVGAARSLALVARLGQGAIGDHDLALAARFRAELAEWGRPAGFEGSPIVAVPETPGAAEALAAAGVRVTRRAGRLRFAFHFYNTEDEVDAALAALRDAG
ncbi:aminotransferase class V-fold PLP-dependent enzyme [Streptomyces sp. NBRC 109706]|uniref:aminotransferase class V-fold PLP-dependent enzyme n=1 Tax=Streptomyces sp. NBRC 109706 TaxID=1550035 RepID=UPI0007858748|nr:aminotransferase class V-fold PLP-dependent enzyme [Streptomyces sp. NBRC 109706]